MIVVVGTIYLTFVIVARLQATPPMKVTLTHFYKLVKANRGRGGAEPTQKKAR